MVVLRPDEVLSRAGKLVFNNYYVLWKTKSQVLSKIIQQNDKSTQEMKMLIYVCIWTHLLCMSTNAPRHMCICKCRLCTLTLHLSTHILLCEYLRLYLFICMCTYTYTYLMHTCTSTSAFMCFNMSSLHIYIHMIIYKYNHWQTCPFVYRYILFMCICDNILVP